MRRRRAAAIVPILLLLGGAIVAPSAAAASTSIDDAAGDVDPDDERRADILGASVDNTPSFVTLTIEVDELVPAGDDLWDRGVIVPGFFLEDPVSGAMYTLAGFFLEGEPHGEIYETDEEGAVAGRVCTARFSVDIFDDAYTFGLAGDCVRGMPRRLVASAFIFLVTDGDVFTDSAPDDDFSEIVGSSAAAAVGRRAGTDRILTAIALSEDRINDQDAGAVVVAAATSFPDALAGGPLAYVTQGSLLLTGQAGLDPRVRDEIVRILPPGGTVFVLGGTAVLSDQVVLDLDAAGYDVDRVAGVNRFETAVAIADEFDRQSVGSHETVLVADGRTFTDALIAGSAAPAVWGVVVLTDGTAMPDATRTYLATDDAVDRIAIGSAAATAASGVRSITADSPGALSVAVANDLVPIRGAVAIASQSTFADALAGGPHISSLAGPLLLTDPVNLSPSVQAALSAAAGSLREVVIYGGTAAVSPAVQSAIEDAVGA